MYDNWEQLKNDCMGCTKCPLAETRTKLVFGVGNENAKVLFIGEGPGANEDLQGEPFVGRGGQLLDKFLAAVDLDRKKNIYIANMVKCRPPQNRDPSPEEQNECIGWLREQTRLLKPKIIVCLGRIAAMRLIREDYRITKEHGQWIQKDGTWMTAIYHPSALLRDVTKRPETFEDLLNIRNKIKQLNQDSV